MKSTKSDSVVVKRSDLLRYSEELSRVANRWLLDEFSPQTENLYLKVRAVALDLARKADRGNMG